MASPQATARMTNRSDMKYYKDWTGRFLQKDSTKHPIAVTAALAGVVGAAMAAMLAQQVRAGDSYISLQGTFSAPSQTQVFDFSLGANALMLARTWGNPGGTNAAGELIAGNGIDSTLTLFN